MVTFPARSSASIHHGTLEAIFAMSVELKSALIAHPLVIAVNALDGRLTAPVSERLLPMNNCIRPLFPFVLFTTTLELLVGKPAPESVISAAKFTVLLDLVIKSAPGEELNRVAFWLSIVIALEIPKVPTGLYVAVRVFPVNALVSTSTGKNAVSPTVGAAPEATLSTTAPAPEMDVTASAGWAELPAASAIIQEKFEATINVRSAAVRFAKLAITKLLASVTAVTACVAPSSTRPVLACLVVTERVNIPLVAVVSRKVIVLAFESVAVDGVTVAKSAFFTVTVTVSNSAAIRFAAASVTVMRYVESSATHVDAPPTMEQALVFAFPSPVSPLVDVGTTVIVADTADTGVVLTPMATNNKTNAANAAVIFV